MRPLALFLIGLAFGGVAGFLGAGGMGGMGHDHMGQSGGEHAHDPNALTDWVGDAPQMALMLSPDMGADLNLHIMAPGFTFAPEQVNGPVTSGTGHAHVYVNGEKVARAYGPYLHLTDVPAGAAIRVTLNANDHTAWAISGQPIAAEITAPE